MSAPQRNTTESKPLKRGRACLTCRFLKIKCDGVKPICGPCRRHPKDDECEYADAPRRSRTKQLEDQVARLEARLREFEHPEQPKPILLHNPYDEPSGSALPSTSYSSSSTSEAWPRSTSSDYLSPLTQTPPSAVESSGRRTASPQYNDEPPHHIAQKYIDLFAKYAPELGFFLHSSFYNATALALPIGDPQRPCSSVLSTVYLWGCHLSANRTPEFPLWGNQRFYLTLALQNTATGLISDHPEKYLHTIQAEILLSYYFLRLGNFLEARIHAGSALSLAIGCGLHRIRAEHPHPLPIIATSDDSTGLTLPPPRDAIEEGERIDGFWQVVILCKTLAVALEVPSEVCGPLEAPGFQIDTPWPLDKKQYESHVLPQHSTSTVNAFLRQTRQVDVSKSLLAMTAQGAVLLQQVTYFSGQWLAGRNTQNYPQTYQVLNHLVGQIGRSLPPLQNSKEVSSPSLFFAHALVFASSIKLNEVTAHQEFRNRRECVVAAQSMINWAYALLKDPTCTSPITGMLLTLAIRALMEEGIRLQGSHPLLDDSKDFTPEGLDGTVKAGMQLLYILSPQSPYMKYQLTTLQASYHSPPAGHAHTLAF